MERAGRTRIVVWLIVVIAVLLVFVAGRH